MTGSILSAPADCASGFQQAAKEAVERPLGHLRQAGKECPGIWREMDRVRVRRIQDGGWPGFCFLPAAGALEATLAIGRPVSIFKTTILGALYAWRATQGVYLINQTLLDELWRTRIDGELPAAALEKLPEWCCYAAFPAPRIIGKRELAGFFVQVQYDPEDGARDLHLALDATRPTGEHYLVPTGLRLAGNLDQCYAATFRSVEGDTEYLGLRPEEGRVYLEGVRRYHEDHPDELVPLISVALYLASTTRELRSGALTEPKRPQAVQTRHLGPRIFPPGRPRLWEVGYRIGATLRAGIAAIERGNNTSAGGEPKAHANPRPHLRAAHWHHYWTGPLKGDRQLIVKWLHPVLVNAASGDDPGIVPTVHRVAAPFSASAGVAQ